MKTLYRPIQIHPQWHGYQKQVSKRIIVGLLTVSYIYHHHEDPGVLFGNSDALIILPHVFFNYEE